MHKWYIITLAALAVLLLVAGMLALILPDAYEGREIYRIDKMHSIRTLDVAGGVLLVVGCATAWAAGLVWQRRTYDS
jgi:drug/metabolite transporter (DMT)-like permease